MYQIGICTEEAQALRLKEAFQKYKRTENVKLDVRIWRDMEELTEIIRNGKEFDVLFLRTFPGDQKAIKLGKLLREDYRNFHTQLIYLAEKECYSRELIQTIPFDFFMEESGKETAGELLSRVLLALKRSDEKFEFRFGKNYYFVPINEIIYLCSDIRRIHVKTLREEFEFNGLLRDVKRFLPKEFLVIHRSFIINKAHVLQYAYDSVRLSDGTTLSVSKTNRSKVKAFMMAGK